MAFVNLQVNLADLPTARELEMEPMSPAYIREVKTQLLIIWAPLLMGAFIPSVLAGQVFLLAIPALLLLLAFLISALVIKKARIKLIATAAARLGETVPVRIEGLLSLCARLLSWRIF